MMKIKSIIAVAILSLAALCSPSLCTERTADDWVREGRILMLSGSSSFEPALYAFDQAIILEAENHDARLGRAMVLYYMGKKDESRNASLDALICADRLLENDSEDAAALQSKGLALASLGRDDEAKLAMESSLRILNRTIERSPKDGRALWLRADDLDILGRAEDALLAYDQVIEIDQSRAAAAHVRKSDLLLLLGRYNESLDAFDQAARLMGANDTSVYMSWWGTGTEVNTQAWFYQGQVLRVVSGWYNRSSSSYENALQIDSNMVGALQNKARAAFPRGRDLGLDNGTLVASSLNWAHYYFPGIEVPGAESGLDESVQAKGSDSNRSSMEDLAVRLLQPTSYVSFELQETQLLVGRLPDRMPIDVPLPPGAHVVGSMTHGSRSVDVVLDVENMTPEDVLDFYRKSMAARNWKDIDISGTSRGFSPNETKITLCQGRKDPALVVTAYPVVDGPTDVRLNIDTAPRYSPCREQGRYDDWMKPLPKLVAPSGVTEHNLGFSSSGAGSVGTSTTLKTGMDVREIVAHYGGLMEAASWTKTGEGRGEDLAWSTWSSKDEDDFTWNALLWAVELPGAGDELFVGAMAKIKDEDAPSPEMAYADGGKRDGL
ncbi:MAG: Tetratricopeptide repeat protein [Methanosaeta sp. PtaB.Bin039]|nr:MAG: Tetratricopeptide repeat protein [Methanosaeta sp. PtaB.Bin039]